MWLWCLIYLFTIDVFRETSAQNRNLCDVCECIPSAVEPTYVNCNCKKSKVLIMKDEDGEVLANTKVINMSSCNFISFPQTGFPKAKKLKSVQIRQMNLFHLNAGVFPSAVNLGIEDINELIIDSFQGQSNLANIEIKNTILSEISEESFKELKNLEKLFFHNVSINTISNNALMIPSSNPKLTVKFINCKVDTIQSEGISLQIMKFELTNSNINVINPEGLNITASDSIDVSRCTFGPVLSPDGLIFRSSKVNIVENEFKSLPSNLLRNVHVTNDKKINFVANTIHDVDLGGFVLGSKLDKLNFVKNKIICDCSPRKTSILKLRDLFPGLLSNDSNFDSIIDTNSCKNYNGIFLSEFKRKFLSGVVCNEVDVKQFENMYSNDNLLNPQQSSTEISSNISASSSISTNNSVSFFVSSVHLYIFVILNVFITFIC